MPLPFDESLDDVLAAWRTRTVAAGQSDRTMNERAALIRRLGRTHDPLTVSGDDLTEWLAGLMLPSGEPISRSSRATYRAQLRSFFGWLLESGRREDDPSLKLPKVKSPRPLPRPTTPAGVQAILAACSDQRAAQTRAYVILYAYAGLRAHEIAKVRGEDFGDGEIRVVGKGGISSSVPMHPMIAELAESMPTRGYWFPSSAASGHVNRSSVSTAIRRAMDRAGIAGTPHALRHHFCTQVLRASGGDLRTTQRAARHANPATTAIYTQIADETLTRAVFGIPAA